MRLKAFDYSSPGAYFVTAVTSRRASLFGAIVEGQMRANAAGQAVTQVWDSLPGRFRGVEIGHSIVMPNHFHGIVVLHGMVGAALVAAQGFNPNPDRAGTSPAPTDPTLGNLIGAFKSLVTRAYMLGVRQNGWPPFQRPLWQRNYYEHVIRDQMDWDRIRRYIEANVSRWDEDEENPARVGPPLREAP